MYFPPFYGEADCYQCEIREQCDCFGKSQRNRRDLEVTSGRCPKIPDNRGFVHESQRENQRKAYPIIYAEYSGEGEEVFFAPGGSTRTGTGAHDLATDRHGSQGRNTSAAVGWALRHVRGI